MRNKHKQFSEKIKEKIREIFSQEQLDALARQTGFIQRSTSRIEAKDMLELITTEILPCPTLSLEGLCDSLRQINAQAEMTPQALHSRINTENTVQYVKEVFEVTLGKNLHSQRQKISPELLAPFHRVFLQDSTQCSLHEKLSEKFRGSGGSASKSALKIQLLYELKQDSIQELFLTEGRVPDQCQAGIILKHLQKGDLIIRDLGYFTLKIFGEIKQKGAFFLSRFMKEISVYFSDSTDARAVDFITYLRENSTHQAIVDLDVYLGKERLPCRLIGYRLSEEGVNQRRRKAYENARKKGKTLSKDYLYWLQFSFYITNVDRQTWSAEVVGVIYRLRWQIELLFKSWKSLLEIHVLKGTRPERIECFLYGRLISITIITMLYAYANWYAENKLHQEVSIHKFINWLTRKNRLGSAISEDRLESLFDSLREDIPQWLCKQKRNRKTTRQLLNNRTNCIDFLLQEELISLDKVA